MSRVEKIRQTYSHQFITKETKLNRPVIQQNTKAVDQLVTKESQFS